MTRVPFVCGNWKLHNTVGEALGLVEDLIPRVASTEGVEIAVAPTFTSLFAVHQRLASTKIQLAAQNMHEAEKGAFTGEISAAMLADVGVHYAIIGHSERRQLFGETDEKTGLKVQAAVAAGLKVILCVGETLAEREAKQTLEVVSRQLKAGLAHLDASQLAAQVVAYEPVWAIGTGKTASPEQAQAVHAHLRAELGQIGGSQVAQAIRLQYGGSVKPGNAAELFAQPDIDGGLIGGAALKAEDFSAIIKAAVG